MMTVRIRLLFLIGASLFPSVMHAQSSADMGNRTDCSTPVIQVESIKLDGTDWKTVKLLDIEFDVPKLFLITDQRCIDGGCFAFSRTGFSLRLDHDPAAFRPIIERIKDPSYSEKVRQDKIAKYWSWNMSGEPQSKFKSGVVVWDEKVKNYIGGLYLFYNCSEDRPIVDKIIDSIKFVPRNEVISGPLPKP